MTLPKFLCFTTDALVVMPWDDTRSYVSFEFAGHLFALVVNTPPDEILDYVEERGMAKFTWHRVGKVEMSATTGECFRPVLGEFVR